MRVRDTLPAEHPSTDVHPGQAVGDPFTAVDGACCPEAGVLLKSIMLRAAFGGIKGDVEMLNEFTAAWRRRHARCYPYIACVACLPASAISPPLPSEA